MADETDVGVEAPATGLASESGRRTDDTAQTIHQVTLITTEVQGVKLTFFPGSHLAPKYFKVVANSKKLVARTHTQNHFYPAIVRDRLNCWKFARATKRTPEWIIYNLKGYLNARWRLVTIDLRSKLWKRKVMF